METQNSKDESDFSSGQKSPTEQKMALDIFSTRRRKKELLAVGKAERIIVEFGLSASNNYNDLHRVASVIVRVNNDVVKQDFAKAISRIGGGIAIQSTKSNSA